MKLNGVVHTSSVLIMIMVFLSITEHAISEDRKYLQRCLDGCGLPPTKECIERCYNKCAAGEAPTVVDQTIHNCNWLLTSPLCQIQLWYVLELHACLAPFYIILNFETKMPLKH